MPDQVKTTPEEVEQRVPVHYDTRLPKLTLLQRTLIPIIGFVVWLVIRLLGPTIRFEVLGGQKSGARLPARSAAEYFCVLAPLHYPVRLVFSESQWRADEHYEFRRPVDAPRD